MNQTTTLTIDDIAKNPEYGVQLLCQDDWRDYLGSLVSNRASCISMLQTWLNEKYLPEETEKILGPLYDKVTYIEAFTSIHEGRALFGWWLRQQSIPGPLTTVDSWSEPQVAELLLNFKCFQGELGNSKFHKIFGKDIYPLMEPLYKKLGLDASFISKWDSHFQNKSNVSQGQVFSERKKVAKEWSFLLERLPVTNLMQVVHLVGRPLSPIGLWEAFYDRLRQEPDSDALNTLISQWPTQQHWRDSLKTIMNHAPDYFQQSWKCPEQGFCVMASLVPKGGLKSFLSSPWVQNVVNTCDALGVELETSTLLNMLLMKSHEPSSVEFDFSL